MKDNGSRKARKRTNWGGLAVGIGIGASFLAATGDMWIAVAMAVAIGTALHVGLNNGSR